MRALSKKLAFTASAATLMLVMGISTSIRAQESKDPANAVPQEAATAAEPASRPPVETASEVKSETSAAADHHEVASPAPTSAPDAPAVQAAQPAEPPVPQAPVATVTDAPSPAAPTEASTPAAAPVVAAPVEAPASAAQPAAETAKVEPVIQDEKIEIAAALKSALESLAKEPARTISQRRERESVAAFYTAREGAPVWRDGGKWTDAARSVIARLEHADEDGLDLRQIPIPVLRDGSAADKASTELALSLATIAYARQASGGRVDPTTISKLITDKPEIADAAKVLSSIPSATDAGAALQAFNPDHDGYRKLRTKLAELRREKTQPAATQIEPGPLLKVGMKDPRVPLIRAHFKIGAPETTTSDDLVYDTRVASAVADFQRVNGLPASGQLTPRTVAVLSGGQPAALEADIIANMERWRWMPHSESSERIEVNIPDYTVRVYRNNAMIHSARVVVGKPTTPTPVFSNEMKFLEVNPYWNVPESIIKKEMMPKLAADPTYLSRMGYEVSSYKGRMVVRQPPGERNALGNIKFMFPNQHAVYLHDTPSRSLFKNDKRAYSHGCVRVDQPFKLAEIVLGKENGWTEERVRKMVGTGNKTVQLPHHIDIHIGYFTAFVDEDGKLQLREDIYGYSRKLKTALGLEG